MLSKRMRKEKASFVPLFWKEAEPCADDFIALKSNGMDIASVISTEARNGRVLNHYG